MTRDYGIINKSLYVIDTDSGLTIFPNAVDKNKSYIFNELKGFTNLTLDSSFIALYARNEGMQVVELKDGLPANIGSSFKVSGPINFATFVNDEILFSSEKGIAKFNPKQTKLFI